MDIKKTIERVPGGMMVVPLIIGAIINTFWPAVLEIGGFITPLLKSGSSTLIGLFLFCTGASINFKSAGIAVKRGIMVSISKIGIGAIVGILVMKIFGREGILGLSYLAVISGMTNGNGGLYAALTSEFGDENDRAATAVIVINSGPFIALIILGMSGSASVPIMSFIAIVLPILIGMLAGNLDQELRKMFSVGGTMVIPFFSFALGANLDLKMLIVGGIPGIILGLVTVFLGGYFNVKVDRFSGGTGVAGASISSVAGNAVATPMAVAMVDPSLYKMAVIATPQVMAAMITTALITPLYVNHIKKSGSH